MRRLDYDAIRREARERAAQVRLFAGMDTRRDQPHDDEHWEAQLRMDAARLERWIATGVLRFDGPRRFILR